MKGRVGQYVRPNEKWTVGPYFEAPHGRIIAIAEDEIEGSSYVVEFKYDGGTETGSWPQNEVDVISEDEAHTMDVLEA